MALIKLVKEIPGAAEIMTPLPDSGGGGDLSGNDHSQQIVRRAGLSLREDSSGNGKGETTGAVVGSQMKSYERREKRRKH